MARKLSSIVLALTLTVAALERGPAALSKETTNSPAPKHRTATGRPRAAALQPGPPAYLFAGLWNEGAGYDTAVVLKNKDLQNPLTVNVILYSASGQIEQTTQVLLGANSMQSLSLAAIVNTQDGLLHSGGLALGYDSTSAGPSGAVELKNNVNGTSITLPLGSGYRFDTENALYTSWLLADSGTDGSLSLFNTSGQAIMVTPWLTVNGNETRAATVSVGVNQTVTLGLRALLTQNGLSSATQGAITLVYSGAVHGLQPALLLNNSTTGYWLAPRFQGRHNAPNFSPTVLSGGPRATTLAGNATLGASQTRWQFPEMKLQWSGGAANNPLHGFALLSNGTKGPLALQLEAHFTSGANASLQKANLPIVSLAPLETRVLDLSQFVINGPITGNPDRVGLVASHAGMPGDVGITMFSVTPGSNLVFHSVGTMVPAATTDISYWQVANKKESPRGILNPGPVPAQVQVIVYYPTPVGIGSYQMPVLTVPAFSESPLKFGQITRVPDQRGLTAPRGTRRGMAVAVLVPQAASTTTSAAPGSSQQSAVAETGICESECTPFIPGDSNVGGPIAQTTATAASSTVIALEENRHPHPHFNQNQNQNQNCFPPQIDNISPASSPAGKTVDVVLSGNYFPQNPEVAVSGGIGVTVTSASETSIEATLDIPRDPSIVGDQQITVSGKYGKGSTTFIVTSPGMPGIETLTPNQGNAGSTVHVHIDGGNFAQGDTISVGGGIAATIDQVSDDENIDATFQIPASASLGPQQVVITDPSGASSKPALFTVNPPPPLSITSVLPSPWQAGTSFAITISGNGFGTNPSLTITDPNGAVTYTPTFASPTEIQASVTVTATTAENASVTVTFGGDTGTGAPAHSPGSLVMRGRVQKGVSTALAAAPSDTVTVPIVSRPSAPVITAIVPNHGKSGNSVNVTIQGNNFPASPSVSVTGGIGVTITSSGTTAIGAIFNIPAGSSALGPQQVTVTGSTGPSNPAVFTVNPATAPPTITSITPPDGPAGQVVAVTIEGANLPTTPTVGASGGIGVTVTDSSDSSIDAKLNIPWSLSVLGPQQITVSGPNGQATTTFTVDTPGRPGIETITPPQATAGTIVQVAITGGNFLHVTGIRVSDGIGATLDQVVDDENIKATFQIPFTVAYGDHQVVLSDLFGEGHPFPFTVLPPPAPAITNINPPRWEAGFNNQLVTITGTNFGTNPSVVIMDNDGLLTYTPAVALPPDPVTGQVTSIQTNVSIDISAPAESAQVTVINNDGAGAAALAARRLSGVAVGVRSPSPATRGNGVHGLNPVGKSNGKPVGTPPLRSTPVPGAAPRTAVGAIATTFLESPPDVVPIDPVKSAIQIMFQGKDIAGRSAQDVFVGQQIALTAIINLPSGSSSIQSEQWTPSMPDGKAAVGGFVASQTSGTVTPLSQTTCSTDTTCDYAKFYWFVPSGGQTLTFTFAYTLADGRSDKANAIFKVKGPTTATVTSATGCDAQAPQQCKNPIQVRERFQNGTDLGPFLNFGDPTNHRPGISFQASVTDNPGGGAYQWVQLITQADRFFQWDHPPDNLDVPNPTGSTMEKCVAQDESKNLINGNNPALDSSYPYPEGDQGTCTGDVPSRVAATSDSPSLGLLNKQNDTNTVYWEATESFAATMYLMWDPGVSAKDGSRTCQPAKSVAPSNPTDPIPSTASTCDSIPVPLGFVIWGWDGEAVNQAGKPLQDKWTAGCGCGAGSTFQKSTVYPQWKSFVQGSFGGTTPTKPFCSPI